MAIYIHHAESLRNRSSESASKFRIDWWLFTAVYVIATIAAPVLAVLR